MTDTAMIRLSAVAHDLRDHMSSVVARASHVAPALSPELAEMAVAYDQFVLHVDEMHSRPDAFDPREYARMMDDAAMAPRLVIDRSADGGGWADDNVVAVVAAVAAVAVALAAVAAIAIAIAVLT